MSKYTELREILKEDIELIVEQRMKERLGSIIDSLMPSIIEHVASSLYASTTENHATLDKVVRTTDLIMRMPQGYVQTIATIKTISPSQYSEDFNKLQNQIIELNIASENQKP